MEKGPERINFSKVSIGGQIKLPSSTIQPPEINVKQMSVQTNPKKQFMKTVNYEDKFSSTTKTSFVQIDKSSFNKHIMDSQKFNATVKLDLKRSHFDLGLDPVTDYKTMKQLMADNNSGALFIQNASTFIKNNKR